MMIEDLIEQIETRFAELGELMDEAAYQTFVAGLS